MTDEANPSQRKKVLVTGATGYVGRHVVPHIKAAGFDVRALVRKGSDRSAISNLVDDFHEGNVTDGQSLEGACEDCEGVVHLVGIIHEKEGSFEDIHVKGTDHVIGEARRAGVKRFVYLSGLGSRPDAVARYHQTKYAAEQAVLNSNMEGYCFPASVIFGREDMFLNLFREMALSLVNPPWPFMPAIAGGRSYLQPVWIEDVAECLARSLRSDFPFEPGTYEIGGPEPLTVLEIMRIACKAAKTTRIFVPVPLFAAKIIALLMEAFSSEPQLTRDQLIMVMEDGRAKNNMTEKILGRPARRMWDYVCYRFELPHKDRLIVGSASFGNLVRPQEGIIWRPTPVEEEKPEVKKKPVVFKKPEPGTA